MYLISYIVHNLSSIIFLILLALPLMVNRWQSLQGEALVRAIKPWRAMAGAANFFLIVSLVSGAFMVEDWTSAWIWVVLIDFLMMGAFLGITLKALRLTSIAAAENQPVGASLQKALRVSRLYALSTVIMFILMYAAW
jgi:hypothetical protein